MPPPFNSATYNSYGSTETETADNGTPGLVGANETVIVDAAKNITGFNNVSMDGALRVANNTNALSILGKAAIGNVGIGNSAGFAHIDNRNANDYALSQATDGTTSINTAENKELLFKVNNDTKMQITSGGDVGINCIPSYALDVAGSINAYGSIRAGVGNNTTTRIGNAEIGYVSFNGYVAFAYRGNLTRNDHSFMAQDDGTTHINCKTGKNILFNNNNDERMRMVGSNGFLGIGVPSPAQKLDVAGNIRASGNGSFAADTNTTSTIGRAKVGYCGIDDYAGFAHIGHNTSTNFGLAQSNNGDTQLNAAAGQQLTLSIGGSTPVMTIKSGGNVGINNTNPSEKLEVIGNIFASGTIVSSDDRLKHNEVNITNGLGIVRQLEPQTYDKTLELRSKDFSGNIDTEYRKESGFIAQEIAAIDEIAYCVGGGDELDSSGNTIPKPYSLNYNNIFTYGISAIKELDAVVSAQAIIIADLEKRLSNLE